MGKEDGAIVDLLKQGLAFHQKGNHTQAEAIYNEVLNRVPEQPDAIHFLGVLATNRHDFTTAGEYLNRAIELSPENPACYNNLGNLYQQFQDFESSIPLYEKTLELDPNHYMAMNNLGVAHIRMGDYKRALGLCQRALEISPEYSGGWNNLGECYTKLGEHGKGEACYKKALSFEPDMVDANWNMALSLLIRGDLLAGFEAYQWRWKRPDTPAMGVAPGLKWNGANFYGKSILIHEEQGAGDTLQFIRYLPLLKAAGARVILEISPGLTRLFTGMEGVDKLWVRNTKASTRDIDRFDCYSPILDLPFHFKTTLDTIPGPTPYIFPDEELKASWGRRLVDSSGIRIGVVWAGNPNHRNDANRSCPLSLFRDIAQMDGIHLYGLQKEKYDRWTDVDSKDVLTQDIGADLYDFADTAAVIAHMDLIISVDTSVAHLAGAMGKPTWVLLPFAPDWRWMLDRTDSPWYPSMELFRQSDFGNWEHPFQQIKKALLKKEWPEKRGAKSQNP
ncbi:MAG: tetratricopeptide repeat-containing glycosyltransferase family protein [Desulfovibrionales bacterium]|nr:tetratricopeptide repeat-containing glycosyltransferase family protein [Desulfovibrionales bacterium]